MTVPNVPVMGTAVPGQFETAAWWNAQVRDLGILLLGAPLFVGTQAVTQSFANNTFAPVTLDTESYDTVGGHSTTSNTDRYTCQVPGVYFLTGTVCFAPGGTGARGAKFQLNGGMVAGSEQLVAPCSVACSSVSANPSYVRLGLGDYVSLYGFQNGGSALSTTTVSAGEAASTFSARFVGA